MWTAPDFDRMPPGLIDAFEGADEENAGLGQASAPEVSREPEQSSL